ncbi:MAG: hypothetical protein Q7S86_05750 [bacterium]|nr:hypothetical protein [bacterium]
MKDTPKDEQWFLFRDDEGGIHFAEFSPHVRLVEGGRFEKGSPVAITVGSDEAVTLLVKCSDGQSSLIEALCSMDSFVNCKSGRFFTVEAGKLIEAALENTQKFPVPAPV